MSFRAFGWLKRYLKFRQQHPFVLWNAEIPGIFQTDENDHARLERQMNDIFYDTLRRTGVLFGCPIVNTQDWAKFPHSRYFHQQDQVNFVYVDTLFLGLMQEIVFLAPQIGLYERFLARVTLRLMQFYLRQELETRLFHMSLEHLLNDDDFNRRLRTLERLLLRQMRVKNRFSFANSLRNNFAFLDIYSLIRWNRKFHQKAAPPISYLPEVEAESLALQKQLILTFSALLWDSAELSPPKRWWQIWRKETQRRLSRRDAKILQGYIMAAHLSKAEKHLLWQEVQEPISLLVTPLHICEPIINRYMLEQTVLLSMIDEGRDPEMSPFLDALARRLAMSEAEQHACESSVVDFFQKHEERFDFIRGNRALQHLQEYIQEQISLATQRNLERLMNEIRQTGRLYSLLVKATDQPLSSEEKRFVREQLLSVAKTIPALAIFCLPAGGVLLPILIKVLPFNILPNSFAETE